MFIQTEATPNPATLKFLPGRPVLGRGSLQYASAAEAVSSPLAERLFTLPGVTGVYLGDDFVTVTKSGDEEWSVLKSIVMAAIMDHFLSGAPVLHDLDDAEQAEDEEFAEEDANIVHQIKELLDARVRPAVAQDGGDIVFRGFDKGIVYLKMRGSCAGCPSSTATLKMGIENMLKHYVPEVSEVLAVA